MQLVVNQFKSYFFPENHINHSENPVTAHPPVSFTFAVSNM